MAEEKKITRLADVGELEADLKKDLAEEEAKGKAADILFCESIEDELPDLEKLPTVDPESLRPKTSMKYDALTRTVTCRNCSGEVKLGEYDNPEDFRYCPFCGRQLQQESKDFALLDEQSKPIGKFCHIYWRHPTTTDCILGDCNVTYEPDGIERTQGYSFSNTPDEIRKWNKRSLSWDMNKAKWR